jgi:hypothetical protein
VPVILFFRASKLDNKKGEQVTIQIPNFHIINHSDS